MTKTRFEDLRSNWSWCMASQRKRDHGDEWWRFSGFVEAFNHHRSKTIAASRWKCIDEIMSPWVPAQGTGEQGNTRHHLVFRSCVFQPKAIQIDLCYDPVLSFDCSNQWNPGTGDGALPNLTYIIRKPEPLGTELKAVACPVTGIMLSLEIQRAKAQMATQELHKKLGATTSCVARMAGLSSQSGQSHQDRPLYEIYNGDSWFSSVRTARYMYSRGFHYVGQVKTTHKHFPKTWLEEKMKDMGAGTWLCLRAVTPGDNVPLIAVGYKYNKKKVLHFIMTEGAGSTHGGVPYLCQFRNKNGTVVKKKIPRPDFISKYFACANTVDVHNQIRQGTIKLEKRWITHDGYFRLWTTILGIIGTDMYLGYKHAVNIANYDRGRKHKDYHLGVRDFLARVAYDLIKNPFNSKIEPQIITLSPLKDDNNDANTQQTATTGNSFSSLTTSTSATGTSHTQRKFKPTVGKSDPRQRCRWCAHTVEKHKNHRSWHYCLECNAAFCFTEFQQTRNCFKLHVQHHTKWLKWEKKKRQLRAMRLQGKTKED